MIYVAAGLVVAALVALTSGRVDPLLVALIAAAILGIAGERGVDIAMFSFAAVALPVVLVGAVVV